MHLPDSERTYICIHLMGYNAFQAQMVLVKGVLQMGKQAEEQHPVGGKAAAQLGIHRLNKVEASWAANTLPPWPPTSLSASSVCATDTRFKRNSFPPTRRLLLLLHLGLEGVVAHQVDADIGALRIGQMPFTSSLAASGPTSRSWFPSPSTSPSPRTAPPPNGGRCKGTGALRTAIQNHLRKVKVVKSFRPGMYRIPAWTM